MKQTIFITGTDTGAGKTVLTALLAQFLRERGVRVAALKPVCSGGREDARALRHALGGTLTLDEINPWHFRAPIAPALAAQRENKSVKLAAVLARIQTLRRRFDVTLVEGAGGLIQPLGDGFDSRDLLTALRAAAVVVAPNKLGVVNHVLLTMAALPKAFRRQAKVVLMSPPKPDAATPTNAKLLEQELGQTCWRLPWFGENFSAREVWREPKVKQTLVALSEI